MQFMYIKSSLKNSPLQIQLVKCEAFANKTRTDSSVIIIIFVDLRYGLLGNVTVNMIKVN